MTEIVNLRKVEKGERVNLSKDFAGLEEIKVRLSWVARQTSGGDLDLDVSALIVGADKKVLESEVYYDPNPKSTEWSISPVAGWKKDKRKLPNFIFYGNRVSINESVTLSEDQRKGGEEIIFINLSKLPAEAFEVPFFTTIYDADERKQNFGQVTDALIEFFDAKTGKKMFEIDLDEDHGVDTGVHAFSAIRNKAGNWDVKNVDEGHKKGLDFFTDIYGLTSGKVDDAQ